MKMGSVKLPQKENKGKKNKSNFVVAFASGKGGTGKTSVVLNTARVLSKQIFVFDCDVEEPNCHIFLGNYLTEKKEVTIFNPIINKEQCTGCGECARFCEEKALVCWGSTPILFPEMCSGCKGCKLVCPTNAIIEGEREIGKIEVRQAGNIHLFSGIMNVGEESPVPIIKKLKDMIPERNISFIDAPPGSSCPVVASVLNSNYLVLVAEETPFGLSDLQLVIELAKKMEIPVGVVNNRKGLGKENISDFLKRFDIPLLLEIPYDKEIFNAYSKGKLIVDESKKYRELFENFARLLLDEVEKKAGKNDQK